MSSWFKCNSPSPKVFSWDFPTAYGPVLACIVDSRIAVTSGRVWETSAPKSHDLSNFINLQMNEFKFAILGTPLLGKARMMFWCDYSLLLVLAGCQNTHHRGVMNWVDGWQRVSDNSQRIWKSSHTLRYTFRFQSLSSKDKQSKTTVLSDFVSACLAMMCLRFEGNYHLANMSEWKKTMRGERERESQ